METYQKYLSYFCRTKLTHRHNTRSFCCDIIQGLLVVINLIFHYSKQKMQLRVSSKNHFNLVVLNRGSAKHFQGVRKKL